MSDIKAARGKEHYYYGYLWVFTVGLGLIGLLIADNYITQVIANPESSEFLLSRFQEWIDRGSLFCIVLFYFYFKALGSGMDRQRHISTFIKLTIWSAFVLLAKIIVVAGLSEGTGSPIGAYFAAAIAHLDSLGTFGLLIFPIATLYMIIGFIRFKLKRA